MFKRKLQSPMSYLTTSIPPSGPFLQKSVEKIKNAPSLALLILAALQLGRAVAVKVAEEVLNERGRLVMLYCCTHFKSGQYIRSRAAKRAYLIPHKSK